MKWMIVTINICKSILSNLYIYLLINIDLCKLSDLAQLGEVPVQLGWLLHVLHGGDGVLAKQHENRALETTLSFI